MDDAASAAPRGVSVIVVNWNGIRIIRECLNSLLAQEFVGREYEVIVVDNGSTDDSVAVIAAEYPTIRLVTLATNTGFAGGANAGVAAARGDVIVLLNNDATARGNYLQKQVQAMEDNPKTAAVTSRILLARHYAQAAPGTPDSLVAADGTTWVPDDSRGERLLNSTGNELTRSGNGRDRDWLRPARLDDRESGPVMGFSGGSVALRRDALAEVGLFDDRLFMYYEDSDLSWRLRRAGWEIRYEREAVVTHQHAASSGASSDFFLFHNERNRLLVALKNAPLNVVGRALTHSIGSLIIALARGRFNVARRKARALLAAAGLAGAFLVDRRRIDKQAVISRSEVARALAKD